MNLAKLSKEERSAIEEDKSRWLEANEIYNKMNHAQIAHYLRNISDCALREDMRNRLNTIRLNRRSKRAA